MMKCRSENDICVGSNDFPFRNRRSEVQRFDLDAQRIFHLYSSILKKCSFSLFDDHGMKLRYVHENVIKAYDYVNNLVRKIPKSGYRVRCVEDR